MKFTQAAIDRATIPADKSESIQFDDTMPGFGLRIREGGSRTFIAQYKIGSKHRRVTIGNAAKVTLDKARTEAKKIFGKVASGLDPANEKTVARAVASHTLEATVSSYLAAKAGELKPRTLTETKRHLEIVFKPLHGLALAGITRAHVASEVRKIATASGPVAANRARATLSAMFHWAIGEGVAENNPVVGTNKQAENGPRDRALTDAEAAAVWNAASANDYGRIVQLLLLTACRRNEIGGLRWSEIDLAERTITLPAERTKNGFPHVAPLSDMAMAVLKDIPRRAGRDCLFGSGQDGYSGWSKSKKQMDKAAKIAAWTLHDLRRTVRTGLGALGVEPHIAEAVLNHLPPKLLRTYDRNKYLKEKRAALDTWANHLAVAIAQATGANVTRLRKA